MVRVYLLWFVPEDDDDEEKSLLIGVYSSDSDAKAAVERLRNKPGFAAYPQGFQIHERGLNEDSWTQGFVRE